MKMKRIIAFFLSLIMCSGLTISALATDTTPDIPSDTEVQDYALHFMTASQETTSISIKDFIHLYNHDGQLTGYYITFSNQNMPAGYMLLSLISGEDPVVEFSFEGAGPLSLSMASYEAVSGTNSIANGTDPSKNIIFTGAGELFIPTQQGSLYSVYDQEYTSTTSVMSSGDEVDIYDGIIDWSEASIDSSSVKKISSFGEGTDYWLMTDFSSGNVCTPTAGTNVLWYWGYQRNCSSVMDKVSSSSGNKNKAKAIFNKLYSVMGTDVEDGTEDSKIIKGYREFFGTGVGDVWNYRALIDGSTFEKYKLELNNNCPIHLVLHTKDSIFDKGTGHCVMNFGYAESTSGTEYLFVMDGWNTYGRFVKFDYYPYFFGYKIWVAAD